MVTIALIVLVGRDEENFIRCVKSIMGQDTRPDEIIFVYDTQYTKVRYREIFKIYSTDNVKELEYVGVIKQPAMRNLAIGLATSDFVWFVDDDVQLDSESCRNALYILNSINQNKTNVGGIAGRVIDVEFPRRKYKKKPVYLSLIRGATGFYDWELDEYAKYYKKVSIIDKLYPVIPFSQGSNMIFNRKILLEIGGFNELLGNGYATYEDSEIGFALYKNGYLTIFAPEISLLHYKMPRIGGKLRTDNDLLYGKSLSRNYAISLIMNNYPGRILKFIYLIIFVLVHPIRMYKYFVICNHVWTIRNIFLAYKYVLLGMKEAYWITKNKNR